MSESEATRNQGNCGPACEGDTLIVEVLGTDHPQGQELCILSNEGSTRYTPIDDQIDKEILDSSVLRVWPWENAPQADVALEIMAEKGDPLLIPLYSLPEVTPRELIRQKLILAPFVPLTLVEREEPIVGVPAQQIVSARSGYLYLFRNNRLWREIHITQSDDGQLVFRDIPLSRYREEGQQHLIADRRPAVTVPLGEIWVPVSYHPSSFTYKSDVRVAWSEVQWSAARIAFLESDETALDERTQRIVQRPDARWHSKFAELVSLDEVGPQRGRQPLLEEQLPCTFEFLSDLDGRYGLECYDLAVEEQKGFFAGGDDAESAWRESQYQHTDLGPTAATRSMVLQDLVGGGGNTATADASTRAVWESIGESRDIFEDCRKRGVLGIVVYDELYEIRKALARANAGVMYQKNLRKWASRQPHYQSAELVEQTILPETLGGQSNPLNKHTEHLDISVAGKLGQALHAAYRAHGINTIKVAQRRLLDLIKDSHNQTRLADLFSLEGGDYQSGFVLVGQLFSTLQHDAEAVDKPWLAASNPDCDTRCSGRLTDADDNPALTASRLVINIAKEDSDYPLHAMLYPEVEAVPLNRPYESPEPEINTGDGRFRPVAFAKLDQDDQLPARENLQTLEALSMVALTEQGAFNSLGFLRMTAKALDGISGQLMNQFNKALQRVYGEVMRIDLDIHGPMVRALKAMNPTLLGELHLLPQGSQGMNMIMLGVEDPEIGLRNGLTEAERDYFNRNNHSGRFLGEIQDSEGRIIGSTNPNRVPAGVSVGESGRFYAFMAPANSELVKNYREVRKQISRQRSLGKTLDGLGLPYVVLGFELWNLNGVAASYEELTRLRGKGRARAEYVSAISDLAFASIAVLEQLSKKMMDNTIIARQMNRVIFDVEKAVAAGRISQAFGSQLPRTVTLRMASVSILALLDASIRAADSIYYLRTGQTASAIVMGGSSIGALMTGWASVSLMSSGTAAASGTAAVLGLSNPAGWIVMGIGLTLIIGGSVAASLLEDDELESWLKNGPFGDYRNASYEHLWGKAPETAPIALSEEAHTGASEGSWSWLPWADDTPEMPARKPVPEREAFYRLANILAGVRIEESLHHVNSAEARRVAQARLGRQGVKPSREEIDALHDELIKTNFRLVVKSNLVSVLGNGAFNVHIRRLKEQRRPNPPAGGSTVIKREYQKPSSDHWWTHSKDLPNGIEYWFHTPKPEGLVYYEWAVRARLVAKLGSAQDYVFPAPPVSDPMVYQESKHGNHDEPDFTRDDTPFWANLTTNRVALNIRAHRNRNTMETASNG
ncbi:hypothetical protein [Marinobacter litoralis]|uniref:hypothetical protein n=1 Tax=Marinobacter litoralis TaxID=187981 RepID=UPI0018ECD106|nr:hypothetical protein [Marinobacter litoralis]MBJ6136517.1 hypothetical protein [Marinobacter litoralis]